MQGETNVKPLSVLVVDDDQALSKLIRHNLEVVGAQVVEAANGFDCIKILHQDKVDLIVLDIRLPDFSGWGILSLLRLTEPLRQIPVILVSVEPPNTALIKQFKPDDYIQKPFDIRDLLARMKKIVNAVPIDTPLANLSIGVPPMMLWQYDNP